MNYNNADIASHFYIFGKDIKSLMNFRLFLLSNYFFLAKIKLLKRLSSYYFERDY